MLFKKRLDLQFSLKKGVLLVFISLIVLSVGIFFTLNPPTYTTTEETNVTQYTVGIGHQSTTVAENSSLYRESTILENRSVYYQNLHPELTFQPVANSKIDNIDVSAEMTAFRNRESNVIWQDTVPLSDQTIAYHNITEDGEINITQVEKTMEEKLEELPQGSVVEYRVNIDIDQNTTGNTTISQSSKMNIRFNTPETYRVQVTGDSARISDTTQVTVPVSSRTTEISGTSVRNNGVLIILGGLIILAIGIYLIYGSKFDSRSHDVRLFEYHLEKYMDWITFGRPFTDPQFLSEQERSKVHVNTLKGLVQVSVDSDSRVIYSEGLNQFYIFSGNHIYLFSPPGSTSPLDINESIPAVPNIGAENQEKNNSNEIPDMDFDNDGGDLWGDGENDEG